MNSRAYVARFNFRGPLQQKKVGQCSGGERNRLLLAKLFAKPSNVLMLDEPTNDLDAETRDLLEDLLVEYTGTLLLVSHDREFLNNTVTSTLVFEGNGHIQEYVGGYDDWLRQHPAAAPEAPSKPRAPAPKEAAENRSRKLSYKEQKELEALPQQIEGLERELEDIHRKMSDPAYYRRAAGELKADADRAAQIPPSLEKLYARWSELDARKS